MPTLISDNIARKSVVIEQARNGFIVRESADPYGVSSPTPYVFETFDSLSRWLFLKFGNSDPNE